MATSTKTKQKKTSGAAQRRKSAKGRAKTPALDKLYSRAMADFDLESQEFKIDLLNGSGKAHPIDALVSDVTWRWEEGNPTRVGDLTLRDLRDENPYTISDGHQIRLKVLWNGHWREAWRMRLYNGERQLTGTRTFELADDMLLLQQGSDDWKFTRTKKGGHPKGWRADQVLRHVCRKYKIPVGRIAKGKHYITGLSMKGSPLAVIQRAYALERNNTGRRFVLRWRNGKLEVGTLRRNPYLYKLHDQIVDGAIGRAERSANFCTAVTIKGAVIGKGKKKHTLHYSYQNKAMVKQYGFIHRTHTAKNAHTPDGAKIEAKRFIAKYSHPKKEIRGLIHRGIAFVERGDAIGVDLKEYGIKAASSVVFVKSGEWTLSGGDFSMSLDLTFDDLFQKSKDADAKARAKKRGSSDSAGDGEWITVGATVFTDSPPGAFGSLTGGYAELGTAGANANLGPLLAPLFGIKGELPENFALQIKHGNKVVTARKRDRGSGQPGDRHFKIDLWTDVSQALGVDPHTFKGDVQIRKAK